MSGTNHSSSASDPQSADERTGPATAANLEATDDVELLRAQVREAEEQALRARAELENFRARMRRDTDEQLRYASVPLVRDLLPVLDNLGRAIASAEQSRESSGLLEGVKMVAEQFTEVLRRHGCTTIDALHEPFDPHRHEAILEQPHSEHPPGTVVQVVQIGYQVHDRVVRPPQVIVAAGNSGAGAAAENST